MAIRRWWQQQPYFESGDWLARPPLVRLAVRCQSEVTLRGDPSVQQRSTAGATGAFIIVTCLFFAWGFITALNDPLVAAVKGIFSLTRFEAQFIAFAFFIAYGLISFPAAALLARTRAVPSVVLALVTMLIGCLIILVAASVAVFPLVHVGLFVLASGITILQVAANPLVAALG